MSIGTLRLILSYAKFRNIKVDFQTSRWKPKRNLSSRSKLLKLTYIFLLILIFLFYKSSIANHWTNLTKWLRISNLLKLISNSSSQEPDRELDQIRQVGRVDRGVAALSVCVRKSYRCRSQVHHHLAAVCRNGNAVVTFIFRLKTMYKSLLFWAFFKLCLTKN